MQIDLSTIIKQRLEEFKNSPQESMQKKGTEYNKDYAKAVQCFQKRINVDRKKEKKAEVSFVQVRMRLIALKEIDDLRYFYNECLKYSYTKDKKTGKRNSFSRAFFGATKVR